MQSVRKSFALSTVSGILKSSPGALRELLLQDHRVTLQLIATLLGKKIKRKQNIQMGKIRNYLTESFHLIKKMSFLIELYC